MTGVSVCPSQAGEAAGSHTGEDEPAASSAERCPDQSSVRAATETAAPSSPAEATQRCQWGQDNNNGSGHHHGDNVYNAVSRQSLHTHHCEGFTIGHCYHDTQHQTSSGPTKNHHYK